MTPDVRRWLRLVEPTDDDERDIPPPEKQLEFARTILERLHGATVSGLEEVDGGTCDDCKQEASRRWRFGRVTLCRPCAASRVRRRARFQDAMRKRA